MKRDFEQIKKDLERLRGARSQPDIFGAENHRFKLHRPLSEPAVIRFEKKFDIRLPEDYRRFLVELGNGGAGPHYGLFRLGEMDNGLDEDSPWKENDGIVGDLSKPFPLTKPRNDLRGEPQYDEKNEEEYDRLWEEFERRYWNPENVNGAIPVCHRGCALRQWLIVTGPEAGNIWCDDRADLNGLYPLKIKGKKRISFYAWYQGWLDEAVQKLDAEKENR